MHYQGIYYDPKGKVYKGQFENGKFKGKGELKEGEYKIVGHFEKNKLNRQGKIEKPEFTYEGDIIRDKPHGWGIKTYRNGAVYKGYFKNGKEQGEGEMRFQNGTQYTGHFLDGIPNGNGMMLEVSGDKYEGDFVRGKKSGMGKLMYLSPEEVHKTDYEGEFKDNYPNGKGVLRFENGSMYKGEFKDGKMQGKGMMDIRKMRGESDHVEIYEGDFANDLFEGYGVLKENDVIVYKGYWRYGKKHGQAEFRGDQGVLEHGLFCNDELLRKDTAIY